MRKLIVVAVALFLVSCASSGGTQQSADLNEDLTLRNRLEQISGVSVQGNYTNIKVYIRGSSSLRRNGGGNGRVIATPASRQQPLFVVDGRKMGRSFYRIASMFTPEQIVSVEVLSGAGANMYGSQGGFGVVVIKTTRGK